MENDFPLVPIQMQFSQALAELRDCAPLAERYGLRLTQSEMLELAQGQTQALAAAGRVAFDGGILPKLVAAFCDSPFIQREDWAETLAELQEAFYYFKSESRERFTDDELIEFMSSVFNGRAQGSTAYLAGTSLEALCRWARESWDEHDAGEAGELF